MIAVTILLSINQMLSNLFGMKITISLVIALIILAAFGYIYFNSRQSKNPSQLPPPNPTHQLSFAGSIGIGSDKVEAGIASFKQNYQKLDELSLYWYNLDFDNRISRDTSVSEKAERETIAFAKQNGIKVVVGI